MCTIAVCGLAHMLESEGVATVVIGLIPQHVEAMRPPRALLVPFELGRPFGAPNDPGLQRDVLDAALALLDAPGPPPLYRLFDRNAGPTANEEPWVCPVSFPAPAPTSEAERLIAEIHLLAPWFDRARKARGHTGTGASNLEIEEAATWLAGFLDDPPPRTSPVPDRPLADTFKLAVEDLKAFYLEAVTLQSGGAQPVNDWLWDETAAGALLMTLRERLQEHPDEGVRLHAAFTLVPGTQLARRKSA